MSRVAAAVETVRDSLTGGHTGRISRGLAALAIIEARIAEIERERDDWIRCYGNAFVSSQAFEEMRRERDEAQEAHRRVSAVRLPA